ncbi:thioredoxin family protein [Gordonibacter sp.]|uniref:thioredoxin family protein n=1 Tax=Gordonibacter sp. TaxID=1968902 RepID=UPI002FCBC98A
MSKGMLRNLFGKKEGVEQIESERSENPAIASPCECGGACDGSYERKARVFKRAEIEVFGPGCRKCHELYANALEAVKASGESIEVGYITDMEQIARAGIMTTPALVVRERVVSSGKVLSVSEIVNLL